MVLYFIGISPFHNGILSHLEFPDNKEDPADERNVYVDGLGVRCMVGCLPAFFKLWNVKDFRYAFTHRRANIRGFSPPP